MKILIFVVLAVLSFSAFADQLDSCASNGRNPLWTFVRANEHTPGEMSVINKFAKETSESPLSVAVLFGYDRIVGEMLKSPSVIKEDGARALYLAASMGRLSLTSLLIQAGVSANAEIGNGLTPIFGAAQYGCVREISLLIKSGANINHKADVSWTLLRLAVGEGNYDAAKFLIQNGYIYSADEKNKIKSYLYGLNLSSKYVYIFGRAEQSDTQNNEEKDR